MPHSAARASAWPRSWLPPRAATQTRAVEMKPALTAAMRSGALPSRGGAAQASSAVGACIYFGRGGPGDMAQAEIAPTAAGTKACGGFPCGGQRHKWSGRAAMSTVAARRRQLMSLACLFRDCRHGPRDTACRCLPIRRGLVTVDRHANSSVHAPAALKRCTLARIVRALTGPCFEPMRLTKADGKKK